jgi:hypothetical protein
MNRKKIKYLIITSDSGEVYGSFYPWDLIRANEYLEELRGQYTEAKIKLHKVSNLNKFLSSIRHGHKKQRRNPPTSSGY